MDKINRKEKPQGMSVTKSEATAKTRRNKQSPENEDWKNMSQIWHHHSVSEHVLFKTVLSFLQLNDKDPIRFGIMLIVKENIGQKEDQLPEYRTC